MPRGRAVECLLVFVLAPGVLAWSTRVHVVLPAIWTLAGVCLILLWRDRTFDRRRLWNADAVGPALGAILTRFGIAAPLLVAALLVIEPARLLSLPREKPGLWVIIMVAYPVLSVYPQEVAFRAFFFHRYAGIFGEKWAMVAASSLAFGYAHVILHNWLAVGLSIAGGMLFGLTYWRTRSLPACCLEHALYGCFLFTIGWGEYLYGGSMAH
jgi:membrane protease YdiL (CAAX protease family)